MQTWGKSASALSMKDYPDSIWSEAYSTLLSCLANSPYSVTALAPEAFSQSNIQCYENADLQRDYEFVLLHKGRTSELPIGLLIELAHYKTVFENAVFLLLQKDAVSQRPLESFYREISHKLEYCSKRLAFIHIPKTAGTSVMENLRSTLPSVKYFNRRDELRSVNGYCAIAGHIYLSDVLSLNQDFDLIFSVLRDPKERFLSAVAHTRRSDEELHSMTPAMQAMKSLTLMAYMETEFAPYEINASSVYLGWKDNLNIHDIKSIRENAAQQLLNNKVTLFHINEMQYFSDYLCDNFSTNYSLPQKNENPVSDNIFTTEERTFIENGLELHLESEKTFIEDILKEQPHSIIV